MSSTSDALQVSAARTTRVVTLVSAGHFMSHFYMLLLPPLFPLMREYYGVGYTELGLSVTVFSLTTGLTQAPIGFLVDRYGARKLLVAGLVLEAVAIALVGVLPSYGALLFLMVLAGLANAVYHPADYSILNASVHPSRMGRAFSIHTFSGLLGNAVAPVLVLFLAAVSDWRMALWVAGGAGLGVAVLIALSGDLLVDSRDGGEAGGSGESKRGWALLLSAPVLMGVLFFVGISVTGRGMSGFGVAVLEEAFAVPLTTAGVLLSAYLFASPVGVLAGGWIADRTERHAAFAAACFVVSGIAVFAVAALELTLTAIGVLFAVAGFFAGAVSPSRDMLIRSLAPPGDMGKVFGFVSTGFNIGGIVAPPAFGLLLDHAEPRLLFWVVGAASLLTVLTVLETGRQRGLARAAA